MRELRSIAFVTCFEELCPSCGYFAERHVEGCVDALSCTFVQHAADALDCTGVGELVEVLVVKDQPNLEARVRYRQPDIILPSERDCGVQIGVVLGPFYVEDAPALVDFLVLVALNCSLHEREWDPVLRVQFKVEGDVLGNVREFLQAVDIIRL